MNCIFINNGILDPFIDSEISKLESSEGYINYGYSLGDYGIAASNDFQGQKLIFGIPEEKDIEDCLESGFYNCQSNFFMFMILLHYSEDPKYNEVYISGSGILSLEPTLNSQKASFQEIVDRFTV